MSKEAIASPAGVCRIVVTLGLLGCAGCANPFGHPEDDLIGPTLQRLHAIETVDLETQSRDEPLTVEQAANEAIEELIKRSMATTSMEIGIADVRMAALANNLDLKVELVNPSIAQTAVDIEEAKFEATFFGSASRSRIDDPVEFVTQTGQSDITRFDLGVDIPLRTGGRITVDFPFGRSDTDNPFSSFQGESAFDAAAQFSISQELLRGAGVVANTYSIKVARYERKITDARTKLEAIRILANADKGYWLVYAARRQLDVRIQQYELAVEQLDQARRRYTAGDSPEVDVTRAESGVASSLEDIIVAETIMKRRQRDLKRIMNRPDLPLWSNTAIVTTTQPKPVYLDLDPVALGEYAVANRMEMLELEIQLAIDAATVGFQKNAALPLFTIDYSYNISGRDSSWGGAMDQIADRSFTGWTVGLNTRIPIGNEAAKSRVHRAILTRLQRLSTKDQRRLSILLEVYDAVDLLNQEWQRILAARQAVILAGRTFEGERRQFDVGMRTSTDVLQAAARLADAQSSEVRALADYEIARVDIAFGTGTLLGYGRIQWTPIGLPPGEENPSKASGGAEEVN
jgi:outer membrane protein TolC